MSFVPQSTVPKALPAYHGAQQVIQLLAVADKGIDRPNFQLRPKVYAATFALLHTRHGNGREIEEDPGRPAMP